MIHIPQPVFQGIAEHAAEKAPNEACGYLAGTGTSICDRYPMTNIDESETHFSFDPSEQFAALRWANASGYELIAIYHSHPATPARLSQEDISLANDPDIVYVVYSIPEKVIRGFRVSVHGETGEKLVEPVETHILPV